MKTQKSQNQKVPFTKKEIKEFEQGLLGTASFYEIYKRKVLADESIRVFFRDNSPKEICIKLFGEEWLKDHPLSLPAPEKGKKAPNTALYSALQNVKRWAKDPKPTKEEPTKEEPTKEEPTKEEPTKEEPKLKELHQIIEEFTYITNNVDKFKEADLESILLGIDRVKDTINKKLKK